MALGLKRQRMKRPNFPGSELHLCEGQVDSWAKKKKKTGLNWLKNNFAQLGFPEGNETPKERGIN